MSLYILLGYSVVEVFFPSDHLSAIFQDGRQPSLDMLHVGHVTGIKLFFRGMFIMYTDRDSISTTVEPAMSSHSYEQPTSYESPLSHSPKLHFVYK